MRFRCRIRSRVMVRDDPGASVTEERERGAFRRCVRRAPSHLFELLPGLVLFTGAERGADLDAPLNVRYWG